MATTSLPVSTTSPVPLTPLSSAYSLRNSFELGNTGKCWRLVHNWHLGQKLSWSFISYISWHLSGLCAFPNLVLDPLFSNLRQKRLGLSINGLYLGAFAHADDIRTSATNIEDVSTQISTVDSFTSTREMCCTLLMQSFLSQQPSQNR